MTEEVKKQRQRFEEKVKEKGYKDFDDLFTKNPITPFVILAKEFDVSYQTVSRQYRDWKKLKEGGRDALV